MSRASIAVVACVTGFIATLFFLSLKYDEHKIESTRFGVVDCGSLPNSSQLCVVKDDSTKQRYLVCIGCEVQEYRRKK